MSANRLIQINLRLGGKAMMSGAGGSRTPVPKQSIDRLYTLISRFDLDGASGGSSIRNVQRQCFLVLRR